MTSHSLRRVLRVVVMVPVCLWHGRVRASLCIDTACPLSIVAHVRYSEQLRVVRAEGDGSHPELGFGVDSTKHRPRLLDSGGARSWAINGGMIAEIDQNNDFSRTCTPHSSTNFCPRAAVYTRVCCWFMLTSAIAENCPRGRFAEPASPELPMLFCGCKN